ncbi:hypothetical protein RZO55_11910 [Clostridium boliviensis]|uniref:Uncharacterized protein n=1 Tax=Clostridium boliviensis TaxID=318465 RepID=A0ABU4GKY3_9CLOT|nr:hypothetical protein [Clostridium boliviensis]MDW2798278.1 hypothetical protein [Clostridium boliviensis]
MRILSRAKWCSKENGIQEKINNGVWYSTPAAMTTLKENNGDDVEENTNVKVYFEGAGMDIRKRIVLISIICIMLYGCGKKKVKL